MKKNLVFFGYCKHWPSMYEKNNLMRYLSDTINDVLVFDDMDSLKNYINNEGQAYKNYILPSRVDNINDLRILGIHSLFDADPDAVQHFDDKKLFCDYVEKYSLQEYVPRNFSEQTSYNNILVVLKPKCGCCSSGIYKKKIFDVTSYEFENFVVQEYIKEPTEHAGYFVSYKGKIIHSFSYISHFGNDDYIKHEGGWKYVPQNRVELDNHIIEKIQKFVEPCSFTGTFCVDFKIVNGQLKIFEINPRIGGSMNSYDNGLDFTNIIKNLIQIYDDRNVYNYRI